MRRALFRRAGRGAMRNAALTLRCCGCGRQAKGEECEECRQQRLQRAPAALAAGAARAPASSIDFGRVRVHADARAAGTARLQRQGEEKAGAKAPPSDEEKLKEAAKKVGEAFLQTEPGKEIKKQATELGEKFVSSLGGKVVAGSAIAGALSYLIATNKELPMQVPEIPLDKVKPGLNMKITWEGPVRDPSKAMVTFTYTPGAGGSPKKPAMTASEKFRAETAKMAAEQAAFREGLKSPAEKAAEDAAFWKAYWGGMNRYGLKPLSIPGAGPEKKEEESLLRRAPSGSNAAGPALAPPIVDDALSGSAVALPGDVRAHMEQRFGHDFGHVRVHADTRAHDSAAAVGARAYTVGHDIVFAAGEYAPHTPQGRQLVAHELAHVVQQDGAGASLDAGRGIEIGAVDDPLEHEAETAARRATESDAAASPEVVGAHAARRSARAAAHHVARAPLLQRDDGIGEKKEETPIERVPYGGKGPPAKPEAAPTGEAEEEGPKLGPASAARPTCEPRGLARKDYLAEPNTSTEDFGLTRLAGTVSMALPTRKVKGGVMLEPLQLALPPITSVFTKADTFIEDTGVFVGQNPGDCPSGRPPLQWRIFPAGAAKIREGEVEHCQDFQYAYDVTFGWYAQVVDDLIAKQRKFPSEDAAYKHLEKRTGTHPTGWANVFTCLAGQTKKRDGKKFTNAWHTPRVKGLPPRWEDGCKFSRVFVTGAANFPELGKHPAPAVIQGCGESPDAVKAVAARAAAAAKAAAGGAGGESEEGTKEAKPGGPPRKAPGPAPTSTERAP